MDAGEFEQFFKEMHPRIVRYAKRRLDAESALDVASQTMQTIWSKRTPYPESDQESRRLQGLTYRIADGHIKNASRSRLRISRVILKLADAHREDRDVVPDAADLAVEGEPIPWLDGLSITDREVLSLVVDGFAVSEIALILECTPAAVSMRLQRAKKNLRLILGRRTQHD